MSKTKLILIIIGLAILGILVIDFFVFKDRLFPSDEKKLSMFLQWTKEDPLFAAPGLDAEELNKVTASLADEEKAIQDLFKNDRKIFPTQFLYSVVNVSKANQDFLTQPTKETGLKLLDAYDKAQKDYSSDVSVFSKTIKEIKDKLKNPTLITLYTKTSFETIAKDGEKLIKNSEELKKEIDARRACLTSGRNCKDPIKFTSEPSVLKTENAFSKNDFLSLDILFPNISDKSRIRGPYIVSSSCFGDSETTAPSFQPFYILTSTVPTESLANKTSLTSELTKLATTNYYRRLIPNQSDDYPLFKLPFITHQETNIYSCFDTAYQNNLTTLDLFFTSFKNKPLFTNTNDLISKTGKQLEDKFFSSEIPTEIDAQNLANYYAYAYSKTNNGEFLNRYLLFTKKMGYYPRLLAKALSNFANIKIRHEMFSNTDFDYIYGTRSIYSLTFLPFSQSFYRLNEPLSYIDPNKRELVGWAITYNQALEQYKPEEITKWHVDQTKILGEAYSEFKKNGPPAGGLKEATASNK